MTARTIDFEGELNAEQLAAVTHGEEPQLILAGAGSGKTRAITYRIAWLVQERGVAPENIVALTFTNKAAAEMRDRVEVLLGQHPLQAFVGTFHRFALRLLRAYGSRVELERDFTILDSSDQLSLVKKALKLAGVSEENLKPQAVMSGISSAKNKLMGPAEYERKADDFWTRQVAKVYHHYQNLVREAGGVDFDDMIRLSHDLLANNEGICPAGARENPVAAGRRVPGHQLRPAGADPPADGRFRPDYRGGRRRPGHLPLARRRAREHPAVRAPLRRRGGAQARAQLPLDPEHPRRRPARWSPATKNAAAKTCGPTPAPAKS